MGILDVIQEVAQSDSPGYTMIPVSSSNIAAIGYDGSNNTLYVAFVNGSVYSYDSVPEYLYDQFLQAASKGKFHHAFIKDSFNYDRIG